MANKANVLFILFEGLADTVIDSQVLSHIQVMQKLGIANFELWVFACDDAMYESSLIKQKKAEELCEAKVKVFRGFRPSQPFSLRRNAAIIDKKLSACSTQFSHIHARTEFSAAVMSKVKSIKKYCLIWDCRGDAVAELDYRYQGSSLSSISMKHLRKLIVSLRLKLAGKACNKALFVSATLKNRMKNYISSKPFEVLPCCASQDLFFYNDDLRSRIRNTLNLLSSQSLYCYSGSLAPYQRFEDTVQCFKTISTLNPNAVLLVLTPELEKAQAILEHYVSAKYILKHATFHEINSFLNATDAAFMLRDPTPTNRVATPTKFAEYCLTGLPVIMSNAVEACYILAKECGNLIETSDPKNLHLIPNLNREEVSHNHRINLSREGQAAAYSRLYAK